MSDISPELQRELSARAEVHYPDVLPYHNWDHALDMMSIVANLADRSINPEIIGKRNLLIVTAAWHDADYAVEDLGQFTSKEERSADLAVKSLPELSDEDRELLRSGIIDTTVTKKPKDSLFGEVTHAADLGYFAGSSARFMGRLTLMRQEWGSPSWETTVARTVSFGETVVEEAKELIPKVLSETDAQVWVSRIERNLQNLQTELDAGKLV
ncbi:MAG: hypothetical protein WAO28_04335 [Candidatus Microsaccharimonas sp.]